MFLRGSTTEDTCRTHKMRTRVPTNKNSPSTYYHLLHDSTPQETSLFFFPSSPSERLLLFHPVYYSIAACLFSRPKQTLIPIQSNSRKHRNSDFHCRSHVSAADRNPEAWRYWDRVEASIPDDVGESRVTLGIHSQGLLNHISATPPHNRCRSHCRLRPSHRSLLCQHSRWPCRLHYPHHHAVHRYVVAFNLTVLLLIDCVSWRWCLEWKFCCYVQCFVLCITTIRGTHGTTFCWVYLPCLWRLRLDWRALSLVVRIVIKLLCLWRYFLPLMMNVCIPYVVWCIGYA